MDMQEFKAAKRAFIIKWGDKLLTPTAEELKQQHDEVKPLCKFARMRVEKMLSGLANAYIRGEY